MTWKLLSGCIVLAFLSSACDFEAERKLAIKLGNDLCCPYTVWHLSHYAGDAWIARCGNDRTVNFSTTDYIKECQE